MASSDISRSSNHLTKSSNSALSIADESKITITPTPPLHPPQQLPRGCTPVTPMGPSIPPHLPIPPISPEPPLSLLPPLPSQRNVGGSILERAPGLYFTVILVVSWPIGDQGPGVEGTAGSGCLGDSKELAEVVIMRTKRNEPMG